jgi:hypothetical protein
MFMSNYVKSTNFAVKDGLPSGDPLKVVKGTEIDTEFNNIATSINSKANLSSPTFIGTPFAPTATPGTATNQVATTSFVTNAVRALYPVGSIYINATNSANPATLLGFGTWVAFGAGRVMVGFDSSDTLFNAAEKTGGTKDAIVVAHTHTGSTSTAGNHTHSNGRSTAFDTGSTGSALGDGRGFIQNNAGLSAAGNHNHSFTTNSTGSSGTNANLQPYITVYLWKRTA